jgi:Ca2+-binding EF-hand superfamily protein
MREIMLCVCILMLGGTCKASDQVGDLFRKLDTNGDGRLEKTEMSESQNIHFARILRISDGDRNGILTQEEMSQGLRPPEPTTPPQQAFRDRLKKADPRKMDRNGDGEITSDEVPEAMRGRFEKRLKESGKSSVSVEALTQLLRGAQGSEAKPASSRKKKQAAGAPESSDEKKSEPASSSAAKRDPLREQRKPGNDLASRFEKMDQNSDGKLTSEEMPERLKARFGKLDADGDGSVSIQELETAGKKRKGGKPENG